MGLFAELQRRKVFRVGASYLVIGWLVIQVAATVLPQFDLPTWAPRLVTLLVALGFPIALVMAWALELTPEGVKVDAGRAGSKRLIAVAVVLVVLALGWYFGGRSVQSSATPSAATPAAPAPDAAAHSIAVLPFENLSDTKGNEYFVSGMQDMILTSLSKLRDLKVISRTSTEKYASRPENLKQVAAELGVAYILEGSVQREGDQVLINLQLIDARSDAHLWAESFERKVESVFGVEREVAGLVAEALRTQLLPADREALGKAPTANREAYDLYLRAEFEMRSYYASSEDKDIGQAIGHYQQALALDPTFALGHARLAQAWALRYWQSEIEATNLQAMADAALDAAKTAKRLAPDLPDADLAMADYQYRVKLDYPGALASYDAVLSRQPQQQAALKGRAFVLRRLGRYDEAIASFSAAMDIDPRDSFPCTERGLTSFLAGHLDAAEADFRRAISLNPEDTVAVGRLGQLLVFRDGNPSRAIAFMRSQPHPDQTAIATLLATQRQFEQALALFDRVVQGGDTSPPTLVGRALVLERLGRQAQAREEVQKVIGGMRQRVAALPENSGAGQGFRLALAWAEAQLGNDKVALDLVHQALVLLPPEKDLANGSIGLGRAAVVYAYLGRADLVVPLLGQIRQLKGTDMQTSAANLRFDPVWDKVRADPGFQAEIARFAEKEARLH